MKTPAIKVRRPYGNNLSVKREKIKDNAYKDFKILSTKEEEWFHGFYQGALTVTIYGQSDHHHTSMDIRFKGKEYNRTYSRYFYNDRGLMLACNRFVKDVLEMI